MRDRKAVIFFFLMTIILFDFGSQIKKLIFSPYFDNYTNPIFSIVHINNTGSAFSLFQNQAYILALMGLFVFLFIAYYVYKNISFEDKMELLSLTVFCAGTLGNLIERFKYNHVVDYIKLNFINFAVFNCFDIMICLGIVLYFIFVLFDKKAQ